MISPVIYHQGVMCCCQLFCLNTSVLKPIFLVVNVLDHHTSSPSFRLSTACSIF